MASEIKGCSNSHSRIPPSPPHKSVRTRIQNFIDRIFSRKIVDKQTASLCIGKTVTPGAADRLHKAVIFDGNGVVKGFKSDLSQTDYKLIIENITRPLNEKPQISEDRILTPGEAMIDISSAIATSNISGILKNKLATLIKQTWLAGNPTKQSAINVADLIKFQLNSQSSQLNDKIDKIISSIEKDFFVTRHNDNYYGRLFDTEFSTYLIDNPTSEMQDAKHQVRESILHDFGEYDTELKHDLCKLLKQWMLDDPPAWRGGIPEVSKFLASGSPADFTNMLHSKDKYSIPLILSIAVKYIASAPGFDNMKNRATQFYVSTILPNRNLDDSSASKLTTGLRSNRYGILLRHQQGVDNNRFKGNYGIRPVDKYKSSTSTNQLSEHNKNALRDERAIGIGMSGSTNLLNFLFNNLHTRTDKFPMDDAKLMTAAYLCFSGGHSINEAYTVFEYKNHRNFKPLSFSELSDTSDYHKKAVDYAFKKILDASADLNGAA
jgi:hypothetical protein